jgi:hypothetical protein
VIAIFPCADGYFFIPTRGSRSAVSSYDDSRGLDALEHAGQPFSYESREGRPYGYSIDLCEAIVEDIAREIGVASLRTEYRA